MQDRPALHLKHSIRQEGMGGRKRKRDRETGGEEKQRREGWREKGEIEGWEGEEEERQAKEGEECGTSLGDKAAEKIQRDVGVLWLTW